MLALVPRIVDQDQDHVSYSSCLVCSDGMVVPMAIQRHANRFVTNALDYHNYDAIECYDVVLAAVDLCCYQYHVLVVTFGSII